MVDWLILLIPVRVKEVYFSSIVGMFRIVYCNNKLCLFILSLIFLKHIFETYSFSYILFLSYYFFFLTEAILMNRPNLNYNYAYTLSPSNKQN